MRTLAAARAAWGEPLPVWVRALAAACDDTSQARVARRLERSPAWLSQIIRRVYPADYGPAEALIRAALGVDTVACPVLGELPAGDCRTHAARDFRAACVAPDWLDLWQACQRCPHRPATPATGAPA